MMKHFEREIYMSRYNAKSTSSVLFDEYNKISVDFCYMSLKITMRVVLEIVFLGGVLRGLSLLVLFLC